MCSFFKNQNMSLQFINASEIHIMPLKSTFCYSERITKMIPFINKCNWEDINFPSEKNDWKIFQKKI